MTWVTHTAMFSLMMDCFSSSGCF